MNYPDDSPAPQVSSTEPSITSPIERSQPMQDQAAPTSFEEGVMLEAFNARPSNVDGNPAAASAAQELNEEIWRGSRGSESQSPGRGTPGLYR